ncbi:hypothetical protein [Methylomagnum ishizawai]|uniref:hypothetical protein n=1 Tax=Methylomagnum ishizawai TaxID=1760988 RepID=UPI000A150DC1|nr:hypothetical protein [Methylomagnum ishizawai]
MLDDAEKHPKHKAELWKLLDSFLARPDDRALFGLEPLADGKDGSAKPEKVARGIAEQPAEPPTPAATGGEEPTA